MFENFCSDIIQTMKCLALESLNLSCQAEHTKINSRLHFKPGLALIAFWTTRPWVWFNERLWTELWRYRQGCLKVSVKTNGQFCTHFRYKFSVQILKNGSGQTEHAKNNSLLNSNPRLAIVIRPLTIGRLCVTGEILFARKFFQYYLIRFILTWET